jgi:Acetyltransferase (GNAT) domain
VKAGHDVQWDPGDRQHRSSACGSGVALGEETHGTVTGAVGPFTLPPASRFEEWLRAPAALESAHPRFDVRRALPVEFDRIYDLVDESFGGKRPRALYDWMYRRNPYGLARCWVAIDRASGRLVGSANSWPWPMARGRQPLEGTQSGDWAVAPGWQGHGISGLCADVLASRAGQAEIIGIAWPNGRSREAAIKLGRAHKIIGPIPKAVLILNAKSCLAGRGWPAPVSAAGGAVADAALAMWRKLLLRARAGLAVEEIRRFDSSFDAVTERAMAWHGLWPPHGAEFLNWRYLDRPEGHYTAFALVDGAELAGYYVLKIDETGAWLMEFAAPTSPPRIGGALLLHLIRTARSAGCAYLRFSAPPRWRHWRLFYAAGFLPVPSEIYLWPSGANVRQLDRWQCVPGDMDEL